MKGQLVISEEQPDGTQTERPATSDEMSLFEQGAYGSTEWYEPDASGVTRVFISQPLPAAEAAPILQEIKEHLESRGLSVVIGP